MLLFPKTKQLNVFVFSETQQFILIRVFSSGSKNLFFSVCMEVKFPKV